MGLKSKIAAVRNRARTLAGRVAQRVLPYHNCLVQTVPHVFEAKPERYALFNDLWREYNKHHGKPYDPNRVMQFMNLLDAANQAPEGDYLELGSHRGLSARLIYRLMDPSRHLYLLDTFEGFVEEDLVVERKIYDNSWHVGNFLPTSPEGVARYVGGGTAPKNLTTIKGWYPQAFQGFDDHKWRFVHVDFDLYQPIRIACDALWPNLVPGGVMVIHDYGCFGFRANIAVDEFAAEQGLTPFHLGDRWGSVAFFKPKQRQVAVGGATHDRRPELAAA